MELNRRILKAVEIDGNRDTKILVSVELLKGVLVSITNPTEGDRMVSWICKKIEFTKSSSQLFYLQYIFTIHPIVHIDQYSVREYTNRIPSTEVKYEVIV